MSAWYAFAVFFAMATGFGVGLVGLTERAEPGREEGLERVGGLPRQLAAVLGMLNVEWDDLATSDTRGGECGQLVDWLYRILDTIDAKTSRLVRFNSIILAAQTFLVGIMFRQSTGPLGLRPWVLSLLIVPLIGAAYTLPVYRIKWPFLGYVESSSWDDIKRELKALSEVCDRRTRRHGVIWIWSCLSVAAFILTVVFTLLSLLEASGAAPGSVLGHHPAPASLGVTGWIC